MKISNPTSFSLLVLKKHAATVQRNVQLEKELTRNKEATRANTEIQEAANEGLHNTNEGLQNANEGLISANEVLLSGNEELQRLNEELEAAKRELRIRNKEITNINQKLLHRNKQLNNSKRYTEEIFNTIYDPLIILNREFKVLRATGGFYKMFKVSEEDTEGNFLYDLGNKQWDIPVLRQQLENVLPKEGHFKSLEVDHVFNNIGRRIMKLTASQFENSTHEKLILLAIHDITDKRKVEEGLVEVERLLAEGKERRHFAIDSAGIGTWDYDPVTGEMIWDSRCRALYGIDRRDDIDYSVFLAQVHPDDRANVDKVILETLQGKMSEKYDAEYRIVGLNDKHPLWLKSKGKVYFDKKNRATRFIGTILDFSAEKLFEEQIKDLIHKKDEFMSIASHELKTPITSLKAIIQILARFLSQKEDVIIINWTQQAIKQIDKLSNLISTLLNVTKLQTGQLELDKASFLIFNLIEECCEQLPDKTEGLVIKIEGAKGIEMYADRDRIEQVLMNIINNAIKYAPNSKLIIIKVSKGVDAVRTEITDFGKGIDLEKASFIFERFSRVEETSKSFTGLGLGLYISSEIIKQHRGNIGVENDHDTGSTFWFTIPLENK
ncbi:MAG: ATP-binding protein [Sphingobacteriaceae bacterium]